MSAPAVKLPLGAIGIYSECPDGMLVCDGSWIDVAAYPDLFGAIGTMWGSSAFADETVRVRLPDLRSADPVLMLAAIPCIQAMA